MNKPLAQNCMQARPYRLENQIQHYDWGGREDRAFIAHLIGIDADQERAYAELWMGAHSSAPSRVLDPNNQAMNLSDWIAVDPRARLGERAHKKFKTQLPYLFKVLSAEQSLSIQAHPNLAQAIQLHKQDPEHYPDSNHKPEIAIALDFLDALVGFVSEDEFDALMNRHPELRQLMSGNAQEPIILSQGVNRILQMAISEPDIISKCILSIHTSLSTQTELTENEDLFIQEYITYGPDDVGLLFVLFLNRVRLGAGEAVFLAPGVPHAYLKGNIVECMANSDNVVRLGLTSKFCDANALSIILDHDMGKTYRVETSSDGFLTEYQTPTEEFRVKSLALLQGESRAFTYHDGLSMFLVAEGEIALKWEAEMELCTCIYRRGDVFVVPANLSQFTIHSKNHCKLFLVDIPV